MQSANATCEWLSVPVIGTDAAAATLFDQLNPSSRDTQRLQNRLGIMYARGNGVAKNDQLASHLFRQLAMHGYTPAMVNLGTMYEQGAAGPRDHLRAYAWIRVALAWGVPEGDYDATLYKLVMIAARLGTVRTTRAEALAIGIADAILSRCRRSEEHCADAMAFSSAPRPEFK